MGDLPIYVAEDSVEVWAHPEQFQLDENLRPTEVAGCPPDGFSATGQLWGNPLFAWDHMREDGYRWWIGRIAHQFKFYDILRIDHFRGFDSYYAIPAGNTTAAGGQWREGPGIGSSVPWRRSSVRGGSLPRTSAFSRRRCTGCSPRAATGHEGAPVCL